MIESMLTAAMVRLDADRVLTYAESELKNGKDPLQIIEETRQGMTQVGCLYDQGKYFLADLMMSAEIFKDVIELIAEELFTTVAAKKTTILFGTVKNDIHDIGKNLTVALLRFNGFNVIDLGVDVSPQTFVNAVIDSKAPILCLSGLVTASYYSMKLTVQALEKNGLRQNVKVLIGGMVNEQVRQFVKADNWVRDCSLGVQLCNSLLAHETNKAIS
ncbi:MAG: cobalamin-dependent protein [Peptococcaceae bacterium]|nr:cobalamin-dependent protein [Peptococcaceae bacterium]